MGRCQNQSPFWGTLNNRCRTILGTQKGTIILTTTHVRQCELVRAETQKTFMRSQGVQHPKAPSILGGSGDLVSMVISTLSADINSYKYSYLNYNPSY